MRDIAFVDAHCHLWDLDRLHYGWLSPPFGTDGPNGSTETIATTYLVDDYRRDCAQWNLRGAVHVDAGADAAQALDETEWLQQLGAESGLPTAIIAFAALDQPGVEALLERQAAHSRVRGIRHIVNWHPDPRRTYTERDLTQDEKWRAGYALLGKYRLSFDLQCYPGQMAGLAPLIARHPETPVIINHLGMPVLDDVDGLSVWRQGLALLAAQPHVAIKLSGFGFIRRAWTIAEIAPLVREVIDLFGPQRCMFATDFPTDKLFGTVDRYFEAQQAIAAGYSDDEQRDLFGRNADRIYRLGLGL